MILTVTLNFAVDVTYRVATVRWESTNEVQTVHRQAGGKGVNVARVLHALGHDVLVTGLAGGGTGEQARGELATAGIPEATMSIARPSRCTLVIVDEAGGATSLSEPGAQVSEQEWRRWLAHYDGLIAGADAVVMSGSLPRGLPVDVYAQLIERTQGIPVLLDASGDALARGIEARPAIVKVNAEELAGIAPDERVEEAARRIQAGGVPVLVVSQGPAGMLAVTSQGRWHSAPPQELRGNPIGAGDAASAALIAGELGGLAWPARLADAVALSAAAVCAPRAGLFDAEVYARLRSEIRSDGA
jgi:tagatose 6-phosphate kinase